MACTLVISVPKIFLNGQFYFNLSSKTWSHVFLEHSVCTSFEACELEITVNYFFCIHLNREWQFHAKSNKLTDALFACPPD